MITYDDFKKVEIRIGKIVAAEKVPDADKLLKLSVEFGTEVRQVISGIAEYYPDPGALLETLHPFVVNLEPRVIRGFTSEAMILAAANDEGAFSLLSPDSDIPPGTGIR